jgi:hypothetical protein
MLVPRVVGGRTALISLSVSDRARRRGSQLGPAVVRQHVGAVALAAEPVAHSVRTALQASSQGEAQSVDPVSAAAEQARSYADEAAHTTVRDPWPAICVPPPLSHPLPMHPRLALDGQAGVPQTPLIHPG